MEHTRKSDSQRRESFAYPPRRDAVGDGDETEPQRRLSQILLGVRAGDAVLDVS